MAHLKLCTNFANDNNNYRNVFSILLFGKTTIITVCGRPLRLAEFHDGGVRIRTRVSRMSDQLLHFKLLLRRVTPRLLAIPDSHAEVVLRLAAETKRRHQTVITCCTERRQLYVDRSKTVARCHCTLTAQQAAKLAASSGGTLFADHAIELLDILYIIVISEQWMSPTPSKSHETVNSLQVRRLSLWL